MAFDNINNYFEMLVFDAMKDKLSKGQLEYDEDYLGDIACVALNQLPSRYVRHNVDMVFYMTIEEREQNEIIVADAVEMAIDYVSKHRHHERPETINQ
jgi:predicted Zn-dependent protease with MMP-like domain